MSFFIYVETGATLGLSGFKGNRGLTLTDHVMTKTKISVVEGLETAFQRKSKSSFSEEHRNLGNVIDPYKQSNKIKSMINYAG